MPDAPSRKKSTPSQMAKLTKRERARQVFSVMPRLLLFMAWVSWFNYFSGDPYMAFTETMVDCPEKAPNNFGECPTGSVLAPGAGSANSTCVPVSRHDPDWSLSDRCADKPYVVKRAADLNGMNQWVGAGLSLLSVFLGGAVIDAYGRKPVMIMSLAVNIIVKALLMLSCSLPWGAFVTILFVQNALVIMSLGPLFPAMNAMVSDLAGDDEALRGECYAWMEIVNHIADVLAFLAGYPVLALHLGDYTVFWGILTLTAMVACVVFCFILRETKKATPAVSNDLENDDCVSSSESADVDNATTPGGVRCARCFRDAVMECLAGFRAAWQDPFLSQFLVLWALTSLAMQGTWGLAQQYAQTFLHMSQEKASMCRALWHVMLTIGSALSTPLIRRMGAASTMGCGLLALSAGWCLNGLGPVMPHMEMFLFWGCGLGIGGTAFGIITPCFNTILSGRVTSDLQGKIFAASTIINTCTGLALSLFWPFYLFNPFVKGIRSGMMWLVSAAIFFAMTLWIFALASSERAVSEGLEASSQSSEDDNSESELSDTKHG
mmetsp:Transcript_742/g.2392  ORF Transcript_742/g.2392 Transcript_742/m.2392 type:complete len:549 (+) Transcript_742:67-1713(+)|eukprot:CAMPEP_0170223770 /NCGR_PEP_ID=MMETSP0116_2-20130129/11585_1 /TAXON_ID=400756 /ORGANISM="Durinskia baltica, Strain CSIRO CS-38" /LENGTH=548 /DNA_ID=CAMNT_0010474473 /DNA_START=67 /DNA_END=1713 /DNA_ORIENTATION=-